MNRQRIPVRDGKKAKSHAVPENIRNATSPPEIRFVRQIDFKKTVDFETWTDYLNYHGEAMHGHGITYALGSMAVTYFSAQEMGKMLSDKYRDAYTSGDPIRLRKLVLNIDRSFTVYKREVSSSTDKLLGNLDDTELSIKAAKDQEFRNSGLGDKIDLSLTRLANTKLWRAGTFVVRGAEPYKAGYDLGLNLDHPDNDAMREERKAILQDFLGIKCDLPTRHASPNFDPHAVFFRSFSPVSRLYIPQLENPEEISLGAPAAIVNLQK